MFRKKRPELLRNETRERRFKYEASVRVMDWILTNIERDRFNISRETLVEQLDKMIISAQKIEKADDKQLYLRPTRALWAFLSPISAFVQECLVSQPIRS